MNSDLRSIAEPTIVALASFVPFLLILDMSLIEASIVAAVIWVVDFVMVQFRIKKAQMN
jgi:hypothetical protein